MSRDSNSHEELRQKILKVLALSETKIISENLNEIMGYVDQTITSKVNEAKINELEYLSDISDSNYTETLLQDRIRTLKEKR